MPLELSKELPQGYWTHNSGGEHTAKHLGDIGEVQTLQAGDGRATSDGPRLRELMRNDGIVVVRSLFEDGGAGPAVAYAIADSDPHEKTITIEDLFVVQEHRQRGIGGFLLSKLVSTGQWQFPNANMAIHRLPAHGMLNGVRYKLSGDHILLSHQAGEVKDFISGVGSLKAAAIERKLSVIIEIQSGGSNQCLLYRDGCLIADLSQDGYIVDPELKAVSMLNCSIN